jgi:hypothetical protein
MDTDLILTVGIVLAVLAIPAMLSAFSESRPPRGAAIVVLISGVLIVIALTQRPQGYTFQEIPDALMRVIGRLIH